MLMIALKGAIRDFFYNLLTARELSPTRPLQWPRRNCVRITCNSAGALHVQHVVCHVIRRNSSAVEFDRDKIAFILALFYWLKPLTDEGREGTGVPGENP